MSKKIVIIEDNQDVRENIAEILELSGYAVETAANGIEGVKRIQVNRPDLIICDIMMPELDGYGVLHILQRSPDTAGIPFIFLTAKSERDDFRKGMNLGADDYITKPFEELQLLEAIEMRLKKHVEPASGSGGGRGTADELIPRLLKPLMDEAEIRSYPKKAPICLEGAYPRYLFHVVEGAVKESRWTEFGKELIADIYTDGQFFGWPGIVLGTPYKTMVSAMEDSRVFLLPKDAVDKVLQKHPELYAALLHQSMEHNQEMTEKLVKTAYESVRKRMAYLLVHLDEKYGHKEGHSIQLLREDIASLAGISKETAIRVLSSFKEEGLIEIINNEITVIDVHQLENVVG